jgi:DNA-binding beta-propeller fold protein YncE
MDLPEPGDRLNSWKEVAAFLGRTVRTVQRWEKEDGLPLRRGGPGRRGAVTASKQEISEWWERRRDTLDAAPVPLPISPSRRGSAWLVAAVAVLMGAAIFAGVLARRPPPQRTLLPAERNEWGRLFASSTTEGRNAAVISIGAVPETLALSPAGDRAYVALQTERGVVAVVDLVARRTVTRLKTVDWINKLVVSRDGGKLFVVGGAEIGVYDLARQTQKTFFAGGGTIRDAYPSPDNRHVWLTLAQRGLKILDLEDGQFETLPTVGCPMYFASAPRSRRLFLSYQCGGPGGRDGHDAIEIIDEVRRTRIAARAPLPLVGSQLALSPDEQHLWAAAHDACAIDDYDGSGCPAGTGAVLHALRADTLDPLLSVRVPGEAVSARPVFLPDGTRLLLIGRAFAVIDRASGTVTEAVQIPAGPGAFAADGRSFVAVDVSNRGLRVFDFSRAPDTLALRAAATHWTGDGTAADVVGGTHGRTRDGFHYAPGVYGQAFEFDAASTGVEFGRRLDADVAFEHSTSYTAWIKPRRTGVPLHVASRSGRSGWRWWLTRDGLMAFCFVEAIPQLSCDGGGLRAPVPLERDRWSHVAVVRNESTLSLFVDGRRIASRSGVSDPVPGPAKPMLRLGAGIDGSEPFHGLIDEVVLFHGALSPTDLLAVRRATSLDAR